MSGGSAGVSLPQDGEGSWTGGHVWRRCRHLSSAGGRGEWEGMRVRVYACVQARGWRGSQVHGCWFGGWMDGW
eukprot:65822-Chlamydomonas_euryale.AAC.1